MARKNRKFGGTSMARYSAKVGKMMKAVSADDAKAMNMTDNATYHFAIGQGGYHVLRANIGQMLDAEGVSKAGRVPFYAMAQYIYKLITKDGVDVREIAKQKTTILDKYFTKGTAYYKIAEKIFDSMVSVRGATAKGKGSKTEVVKAEATKTVGGAP